MTVLYHPCWVSIQFATQMTLQAHQHGLTVYTYENLFEELASCNEISARPSIDTTGPRWVRDNISWASFQIRKIVGCACAGKSGTFFACHRGLAIPICITACDSRTCRDACRDRWIAISFKVGGRENVPDIPGACATRELTYLVRGPWNWAKSLFISILDSWFRPSILHKLL